MVIYALGFLLVLVVGIYALFEYWGVKIKAMIRNNVRIVTRKDTVVKVIDNDTLKALESTYKAVPFTGGIKVGVLFIGADNLIHAGIWDLAVVMHEDEFNIFNAPIGKDCLVKHLVDNLRVLATRFEFNTACVVSTKKYNPIG